MHGFHVMQAPSAGAGTTAPPQPTFGQRSLRRRVFWRGLPWTAAVVIVYVTQMVTSILMGGEWNTALVAMQAIVVASFVAIFYALALAKEKESIDPA